MWAWRKYRVARHAHLPAFVDALAQPLEAHDVDCALASDAIARTVGYLPPAAVLTDCLPRRGEALGAMRHHDRCTPRVLCPCIEVLGRVTTENCEATEGDSHLDRHERLCVALARDEHKQAQVVEAAPTAPDCGQSGGGRRRTDVRCGHGRTALVFICAADGRATRSSGHGHRAFGGGCGGCCRRRCRSRRRHVLAS